MSRRSRIFSGIALALALTACGDTGGDPLGPGAGPSMNGGLVTGSNGTAPADSTGTGTQSTTTEPDSASTGRTGGLVTGSN